MPRTKKTRARRPNIRGTFIDRVLGIHGRLKGPTRVSIAGERGRKKSVEIVGARSDYDGTKIVQHRGRKWKLASTHAYPSTALEAVQTCMKQATCMGQRCECFLGVHTVHRSRGRVTEHWLVFVRLLKKNRAGLWRQYSP